METATSGFGNGGLWPVDRRVFTHADFAPSVFTHPIRAAKAATPKRAPECCGYIAVGKISRLPSNSERHPRQKQRKKHSAAGVVLTGSSHKKSQNRPNKAGCSGA
jgi:hypothetical protein